MGHQWTSNIEKPSRMSPWVGRESTAHSDHVICNCIIKWYIIGKKILCKTKRYPSQSVNIVTISSSLFTYYFTFKYASDQSHPNTRYCASSPDNSFSFKSCMMLSIYLRFGLHFRLFRHIQHHRFFFLLRYAFFSSHYIPVWAYRLSRLHVRIVFSRARKRWK